MENNDLDDNIAHKLQQAQKKILAELDRVCKELGLTYCMAFGSSLGAVRHHGFIPWDDDIDVYMRVEELEILQQNSGLFKCDYFLQSNESDAEYGLMITRLRNSRTTLIEKNEVDRDINHGIFVDIYPLFNCPSGGFRAKKQRFASMVYRLLLYGVVPQNRGIIMKLGSAVMLKMVPQIARKKIIACCYKSMRSYKNEGYVSSLYGDEDNIRYPEEWFFPVKYVPFEDIEVPVQADTDKYLKLTYGDYMKLPPIEKRMFHHDYVCVDFDTPYTEYKGTMYCTRCRA